jgi:hypothetical protein
MPFGPVDPVRVGEGVERRGLELGVRLAQGGFDVGEPMLDRQFRQQ